MKKVNAGSLFFVIVVAGVISLLSMSVILSAYFTLNQDRRHLALQRLRLDLSSAKFITLARQSLMVSKYDSSFILFAGSSDSVRVRTSPWGIFAVGKVNVSSNRWRDSSLFLIGSKPEGIFKAALYLSDLKSSLTLSGDAQITGDAYLPSAGINAGYVDGKSYQRDSLIYGKIKRSNKTLPIFQINLVSTFTDLLEGIDSAFKGKALSVQALKKDTLSRSFSEEALIISSKDSIKLDNIVIQGQVVIYSKKSITVDATAMLDQVILIAPKVSLSPGVTGSIQVFARDTILVSQACKLKYPSSLILMRTAGKSLKPCITLDSLASVEGIVASLNGLKRKGSAYFSTTTNDTYITVKKDASVIGYLYCNGYLELLGMVRGTVLCDHFLYHSTSTLYENHLIDAHIYRSKLDTHFLGDLLLEVTGAKHAIVSYLK